MIGESSDIDCSIDERFNVLGSGKCNSNRECRGYRICHDVDHECLGLSGCSDMEAAFDSLNSVDPCSINEKENALGAYMCETDNECQG